MNYQLDIVKDFIDYELIVGMEVEHFDDAMKAAKESGEHVVIQSYKTGNTYYVWPDGIVECYGMEEE